MHFEDCVYKFPKTSMHNLLVSTTGLNYERGELMRILLAAEPLQIHSSLRTLLERSAVGAPSSFTQNRLSDEQSMNDEELLMIVKSLNMTKNRFRNASQVSRYEGLIQKLQNALKSPSVISSIAL